MNKRIAGGLLAAGLAFSAFSASAAGLGVDADPLQVGAEHDLQCDEDGVTATIHFGDQEAGPEGRNSNGVTVSGIDETCFGAYLTVSAIGGDGELARLSTYTDVIDSTTETLTGWSLDPLDITGVEVHING